MTVMLFVLDFLVGFVVGIVLVAVAGGNGDKGE